VTIVVSRRANLFFHIDQTWNFQFPLETLLQIGIFDLNISLTKSHKFRKSFRRQVDNSLRADGK